MAAVIVRPEDWAPGAPMYYSLGMGNHIYTLYNAGSGYRYDLNTDYALKSVGENSLRFEVHSGDTNWYDAGTGKERSEVGASEVIDYGTPMDISYGFTLEKGAPNTAKWMVIGQIHTIVPEGMAAAPPPFAITMTKERMAVTINYVDENGKAASKTLFKDPLDIERGHEYKFEIQAKFDVDGNGRLVVIRDGVTIVDYSGVLGDHATPTYWQEGIYRYAAPETVAAVYSNLSINSGDSVQIPPQGSAQYTKLDAPTLDVVSTTNGANAVVTLEGVADKGQKINIYDGTDLVKTVVADASGHFKTAINLSESGDHFFKAAVVDAKGIVGEISEEAPVVVGTSAEILNAINYIPFIADLGGIILTDKNVFTISSLAQMQAVVDTASKALEKLAGDYTFQFLTGPAGYKTLTTFDSHGVKTEAVTTTVVDGIVTRETHIYYKADAPVAKEVIVNAISDKAYASTYQAFNAKGDTLTLVRTHKDGTLDYSYKLDKSGTATTQNFDAKGVILNEVVKTAAGVSDTKSFAGGVLAHEVIELTTANKDGFKKLVYDFNIAGKEYGSQLVAFDASGKQVSVQHFAAATVPTILTVVSHPVTPTLAVEGKDGHKLEFSGAAASGMKVVLYDGSKAVGSAITDSKGHFVLDIDSLTAGVHALKVQVADSLGNLSDLSKAVSVNVMTAAQFTQNIESIASSSDKTAIWLKDSSNLLVHFSKVQSMAAEFGAAFDKVLGGVHLQALTGPEGFKLLTTYDVHGAVAETYLKVTDGGKLIREVYEYHDGSSPYAKEVFKYSDGGDSHQAYDASGKIVLSTGTLFVDSNHNLTGTDYNDVLVGGTGNDIIHGGAGKDTLYGMGGSDILSGGFGADTFLFNVIGAVDRVADFNVNQKDVLDVSGLLLGYNSTQSAIDDFVTFTNVGDRSLMSVDRDGSGTNFTFEAVAFIGNTNNLDADSLLKAGNLVA